MLRLVRLQPHLGLLDRMLPIRLMQIPQLNRRHPITTAVSTHHHSTHTETRTSKTHTTNPTKIPNHSPSNRHRSTHPTENEIGSATR